MKIGIIGGTGVYDPEIVKDSNSIKLNTPYGALSDLITVGKIGKIDVVIIPRHGVGHIINPTKVNYRANIWAMKHLGVTHILAPTAVGSLREEIKPGDFVFPDQFIDFTKKRQYTFYEGNQVCHISTAEPFCPTLRTTLMDEAKKLKMRAHPKGTIITIEGPRFSTKAESMLFRSWGADIINMTTIPECILAREAEMCYAAIAMSTDYDCWKEHHVSGEMIIETMKENIGKVRRLLAEVIPKIKDDKNCICRNALKGAFI